MNQQLKKLASIPMDEQQKKQSWGKIEQRMKRPKWKIPVLVTAVCTILLLLFVVVPPPVQNAEQAPTIKQLLVSDDKENVYSMWQPGVWRVRETERLQRFEQIVEQQQLIPKQDLFHELYTVRVEWSDGSKQTLQLDSDYDENLMYLYDRSLERYYEVVGNYQMLDHLLHEGNSIPLIATLSGLYILFTFAADYFRPKDRYGRKPPFFSSYWQTLVYILLMLSGLFIAMMIHVGLGLLLCLLGWGIIMTLEYYTENSKKRMISITLTIVGIMCMIFTVGMLLF